MTARIPLISENGWTASCLRYDHTATPSIAVHLESDLLHHRLHIQPPPNSEPRGCTQHVHSIWTTCRRPPGLGWSVRHHAGPHSSVCRVWIRIHRGIRVGEIFQKRDLENLEKRDFFCTALAEGFLRSCHSIPRVI